MTTTSPKSSSKSSVAFNASLMLALAPAAAMLFLWPEASAQTPAKTAQVYVSIETAVDQDADALRIQQLRIKNAARSVCSTVAIHSPLTPRKQSDCRRETVAHAMKQLAEIGAVITVASAD